MIIIRGFDQTHFWLQEESLNETFLLRTSKICYFELTSVWKKIENRIFEVSLLISKIFIVSSGIRQKQYTSYKGHHPYNGLFMCMKNPLVV